MADSLLSYAITTGVFIGLVVILSASRAKRVGKKKEPLVGNRGNQTITCLKNKIDLLTLKEEIITILGYVSIENHLRILNKQNASKLGCLFTHI